MCVYVCTVVFVHVGNNNKERDNTASTTGVAVTGDVCLHSKSTQVNATVSPQVDTTSVDPTFLAANCDQLSHTCDQGYFTGVHVLKRSTTR